MNEDFDAQEENEAPVRRTKRSQRKAKSVHSMYHMPVPGEHAMPPQPLRRVATAPPAYMNHSFYMDPSAGYGGPPVYPAPYYPGFQGPVSPMYYPPPQQPTVIIRQNQRVISPVRDRYDDNNETFEGFFGPDVVPRSHYVHHTPVGQQQEQLESYERSRSPHTYHTPSRRNNEMSVAEARALEEAIQLSLTESSHRASRPTRQRDGSFNTEDFESGFTTMSASSNDNGVKSPEALADEKALQQAILLSLHDSGSYDEYAHTQGHGSGQAATSHAQREEQRFVAVPPAAPVTSPSAMTGRQYPYNLSPELRKKSSFRSSFDSYPMTYEVHGANRASASADHAWEATKQQTQFTQQKVPPPRSRDQHLSLDVVIPPLPLHNEDINRIDLKYGGSQQYHRSECVEYAHLQAQQSPREREHADSRRGHSNTRSSYPPDRHHRSEALNRTMSAPMHTDRSAVPRSQSQHLQQPSFHQYHHADPRAQQQQATRVVLERRSASATRSRPTAFPAAGTAGSDPRRDADLLPTQRRGASTSPPRARSRPADAVHSYSNTVAHRSNEIYTPRSDQAVQLRGASDRPLPPAPLQKQLSNNSIQYDPYNSASEFENSQAYSRPPPEPPSYAASRRSETLWRPDSTATLVRPAPPVMPQRGFSTSTVNYDGDAYNSTSEVESRQPHRQDQQRWPSKATLVTSNATSYRPSDAHMLNKPSAAMRPPPPFAPQRDLSNTTVQYDSQAYTATSDSDSEVSAPYEDIRMQSSRKNSPRDDSLAPGASGAGAGYLSPRRESMQDDPLSARRVYPGPSLHTHHQERTHAPTYQHQGQGQEVRRADGYSSSNAMY